METAHQFVFTTCPDATVAETLAQSLVEEGLAACANILPGLRSIYRWKGKTERADEVLVLIKTTASRYHDLEQRIIALHPYELPEIVTVPITNGLAPYLAWLENPERKS
ncbi:MAG: divalent-cation tolerance protein CutA [Acidiferrobacteraceae bacterium]|jgi:periplasmic divalent cation tolerance protein